MFRISVLCLFIVAAVLPVHAANKIDARFSVLANAEPVPLEDMVNGWDGDYRRGELAFADLSWDIGFSKDIKFNQQSLGRARISKGYRIYYYLTFDKETADFYRALEQKQSLEGNKKLDLTVKHFESPSVSVSYLSPDFNFMAQSFTSSFSVGLNMYKPGHLQFGKVKGFTYGPTTDEFSANINYRYDQFKLPLLKEEQNIDTRKGNAYTLDFGLNINTEDWQLAVNANDFFSQFNWQQVGVTQVCVQSFFTNNTTNKGVCATIGGNGRSDIKAVSETIPVSYHGLLKHKQYDVSLLGFQHGAYQRLGIEKGFQTGLGRFGLFLYHPQLLGASWQTDYFNVQFGADTLKLSKARNIQLSMGVNWHW